MTGPQLKAGEGIARVPKCTHWLGHKFQGRYSHGPAQLPPDLKVSIAVDSLSSIYERFRTSTYECDVCVRCGHVVQPPIVNEPAP